MTEPIGRPAYQQVADDLRLRITTGEFPVGSAIPSTAKLTKKYGVSITVIRAAIARLREDGLLIGQPGKGVFVRSTPDSLAERAVSIDDMSRQIEEFRAELRRIESVQRAELSAGLGALSQRIDMMSTDLAALYAQLGRPYPTGKSET